MTTRPLARLLLAFFATVLLLGSLSIPALAAKEEKPIQSPPKESWPALPERDGEGFLLSGDEWIYEDEPLGLWLYFSKNLQVEIQRFSDPNKPLIWYESLLTTRGEEHLMAVSSNPNNPGTKFQYSEPIARKNHLVFAVSDDYFGDRRYNHETQGIIIRGGEILSEKTYKNGANSFPNLDTMAFYPDGRLMVYKNNEYTAQEYLQMGATDVFAFGPIMIRDGKINDQLGTKNKNLEPRNAFGMISPGRYVSIVVEGRSSHSKGTGLTWLAERLVSLGVTEALNLDGGQTEALVFMGNKLNTTGKFGKLNNQRSLSGMIAVGVSDKVPPQK
jgi:uncharacterized protein YigE (DUF2233 family)